MLENLLIGDLATEDRWRIGWKAEGRRARATSSSATGSPSIRRAGEPSAARWSGRCSRSCAPSTSCARSGRPPAAKVSSCSTSRRRSCRRPTSSSCSGSCASIVADGASVIFVSHDIDEVLRDHRPRHGAPRRPRRRHVRDPDGHQGRHRRDDRRAGASSSSARARLPAPEPGMRACGSWASPAATVEDLSLDVAAGEIIGLTGLIGSGYDEVVYLLYGATGANAGVLDDRRASGTTLARDDARGRHRGRLRPRSRRPSERGSRRLALGRSTMSACRCWQTVATAGRSAARRLAARRAPSRGALRRSAAAIRRCPSAR